MAEGGNNVNDREIKRFKSLDGLRKTDIDGVIDDRRIGYEQEGDNDIKFHKLDSDDGQEVIWFEKENSVTLPNQHDSKF